MGVIIRNENIEFEKNKYIEKSGLGNVGFGITTTNFKTNKASFMNTNTIVVAIVLDTIYLTERLDGSSPVVKLSETIDVSQCTLQDAFIRQGVSVITDAFILDTVASVRFSKDNTNLYMTITANFGTTGTTTAGQQKEFASPMGGFYGFLKYKDKYMLVDDVTNYTNLTSPVVFYGSYEIDNGTVSTASNVKVPTKLSLGAVYEYISIDKYSGEEISYGGSQGQEIYNLLWNFGLPNFGSGTLSNERTSGHQQYHFTTAKLITKEIIDG